MAMVNRQPGSRPFAIRLPANLVESLQRHRLVCLVLEVGHPAIQVVVAYDADEGGDRPVTACAGYELNQWIQLERPVRNGDGVHASLTIIKTIPRSG